MRETLRQSFPFLKLLMFFAKTFAEARKGQVVFVLSICGVWFTYCRGRIQRKTWCMGPYAGVDYNLTLCPLQSRLQHIYIGQPYARVDLNPMPESTLSPQSGTLDLASVNSLQGVIDHLSCKHSNTPTPTFHSTHFS
jgi:hypothetical protein